MTGHLLRTYLKTLFFILACTLLLCCAKNNHRSSTTTEIQVDSIRIWIDQSKQKNLAYSAKFSFLTKAYEKLAVVSNDSLKCKYLTEISFQLRKSNNERLFRKVNGEGMTLALRLKDSLCRSTLHWDRADFFKSRAIQDSAYYHYTEAEKIFTKLNDDFSSGSVLFSMARVQNNIGDYIGSEVTTIKAIEKLKPLNKYRQLTYCYDNLGDVAKLLNKYDLALDYYNESLIYLRKANLGPIREVMTSNNIGLVYQQMGQHKKAAAYFSEVVHFDSLRFKSPQDYARSLSNLGYSYLKLNNTEQLPTLFEQAFKIQDSTNDVGGKMASTFGVAEYLLSQKDTANALAHLRESQKFATQASIHKKKLEILRMFSRLDPKNATEYTQAYVDLSDSLQNQERQLRDKFARIRFETDEFIAENQLLARQRQLWTGISLAILLLSVAAFVIISQRTKNQKLKFQQEQQTSNQEILSLLLAQGEKLEEGKQIEQKRISEELHDGVQGRLQGARMMLLGLNKREDEKAVAERARAITMLKDIQEEVRAISHELSHAAYQKIHNFILSLEDLKVTTAKSANIEINFKYAEQLDWDALNSDIKINLYRIVQESLQNAVKHAKCSRIDLNLEADAEHIKVSIIDDGTGFVIKKGKKGIGMRNIASRMKKLDGTWDIASEIGNGTKVTLIIPIVENAKTSSMANELKNLQKA